MNDATKTRLLLAIVAALSLLVAAMAYKFIVAGSGQRAQDGRFAIALEPAERALVLGEMREFVAGLQAIADALSREDMKDVAKASRAMGMGRSHDVPVALMGKLPLGFKTMGLAVHRAFDVIAMDAEGIGMPKHTLGQLSEVLRTCVACHGSYQIATVRAP